MSVVEYQVVYSRRKTLALQVKAGRVVVRAPYGVTASMIERLVLKKRSWLDAKLKQSQVHAKKFPALAHRTQILILGQYRAMSIVDGQATEQVVCYDDQLSINLTVSKQAVSIEQFEAKVSDLVKRWLHKQSVDILAERVAYWSKITGLVPASYKIKYYKSKWGSCNSNKVITFNSLLAMAPGYVIDYVVVHEFCHLVHLNHSSQFWQLVESYLPSYKQAKVWLKQHQNELNLD